MSEAATLSRRARDAADQARAERGAPFTLSAREVEVIEAVADGLTNAEIGALLYLSPITVKDHLSRIQPKLRARNRAHVAALAIRCGVIPMDPATPDRKANTP